MLLTSTGPMVLLGLLISCLIVLVRETEVPQPIRTGELNMGGLLEFFPSRGIVPSISFWFTTAGCRKIRAPLRAMSVPISSEGIFCNACKVSLLAASLSEIGGSIGGMMTGIVRLINNFVENFR